MGTVSKRAVGEKRVRSRESSKESNGKATEVGVR